MLQDRAQMGLGEKPEAAELAVEAITQPEVEQVAQPKRSHRKQDAQLVLGAPGISAPPLRHSRRS